MQSRPWALCLLWVGCTAGVQRPEADAGSLAVVVEDAGVTPIDGGTKEPAMDAGVTVTGSCAAHSYKFCEDFESTAAGAMPAGWSVHTGFGDQPATPTVVSNVAHSGVHALKSESAAVGQSRLSKSLSAMGATAGSHWGRIYFKVNQPVPMPSGYFHSTMLSLVGPSDESRVIDTLRANPSGHVEFGYQLSMGSFHTDSDYLYTFDANWRCVEWRLDATTQSFQFFLDGTEITALGFSHMPDAHVSQYTSILIGAVSYQSVPSAFIVWFDDLALNDTRIGCAP